MIFVILVIALLILFDYMPAFNGKIAENKRDFTVFLCLAIFSVGLLIAFVLDAKIPSPMQILEAFFKNIGLSYGA